MFARHFEDVFQGLDELGILTFEARRFAHRVMQIVRADEHGIDAGYHCDGWLWTATSAAQVGAWKATLAVVASFVALIIASYSGAFWYVLALSGLGTAAAVIAAFVLELRNDRAPA